MIKAYLENQRLIDTGQQFLTVCKYLLKQTV